MTDILEKLKAPHGYFGRSARYAAAQEIEILREIVRIMTDQREEIDRILFNQALQILTLKGRLRGKKDEGDDGNN